MILCAEYLEVGNRIHSKMILKKVLFTFFLVLRNPVLQSLSVYSNAKKIFACKSNQPSNVMPCLDGIRAIASLSIIACHFEIYATDSAMNSTNLTNNIFFIFSANRFSVDTFFVLSSFLVTIKILTEYSR